MYLSEAVLLVFDTLKSTLSIEDLFQLYGMHATSILSSPF